MTRVLRTCASCFDAHAFRQSACEVASKLSSVFQMRGIHIVFGMFSQTHALCLNTYASIQL